MSYTEPDLMSPAEEQSVIRILNVTLGLALPGCLRVAAELNIADHLADGPLSVTALAERTGSDPDNLRRILRMLALNGIFTGTDDDSYRLSPDAEFLRRDHPCSQRDAVLTLTDNTYWSTIGQLNESVRGELNFKKLFGKTFYEYQATKPNRNDTIISRPGCPPCRRWKTILSPGLMTSRHRAILPISAAAKDHCCCGFCAATRH